MGDVAAFEFTGAFSVECWVKYTTVAAAMEIVSKMDAAFKGWSLKVRPTGPTGRIQFLANSGIPATVFSVNTTAAYNDGKWHHVVATWDGTTGANQVIIYVDGVVAATGTALAGTIDQNAAPFCIGAQNATLEFFSGSVDEVAVYDRALSPAEVKAHYLTPLSGRWFAVNEADRDFEA
jgi:trimeric autotransporter adhesin